MIQIIECKLSLDEVISKAIEKASLRKYVMRLLQIKETDILSLEIDKKALDARKKDHIVYIYNLTVETKMDQISLAKQIKNVRFKEPSKPLFEKPEKPSSKIRPVVVGFGPSGIFSAYILAKHGYRPIVLEQGLDVDQRIKKMDEFYQRGIFEPESSILFGEGGAGTYSDGKLTTLINDPLCRYVTEVLVEHGCDPEIMYLSKPHIGTDVLREIIKNIRHEIISLGGEVHFHTKVTGFVFEQDSLTGVICDHRNVIPTTICLLGTGHSARDTYQMLYDYGFELKQKPFSIGVRIEHLQSFINQNQYGKMHHHPSLRPAEYKLSHHTKENRGVYTFCMCPGGYVVCATSEEGGVLTNGMSESKRDGVNANAALLVSITPSDFPTDHPLAGIAFQRAFEQKSFEKAGRNYFAPVQLVGDFLNHQPSTKFGEVKPTYQPGVTFVDFHEIYPKYITDALKEGLRVFDQKIRGFASHDALLTGVETRSSSPVRIERDASYQANKTGLYPMGEGAGYAGGIMSSAVDGMKVAFEIIKKLSKEI